MHEEEIAACLKRGIATLKSDKAVYWPAQGVADFHESNMVLHAGIGLKLGGCAVYAEVQVRDAPQNHVDLFALHMEHRWAVALEAKRLYTVEKAASIAADWARLSQIKLPNQFDAMPEGLACYAGIIASCWNEGYAAWWRDPKRAAAPGGARRTDSWSTLKSFVDCSAVCDGVNIQRDDGDPHWILYALTRLPDDQW